MKISDLIPKRNERSFLCGMTSSGKTTLAEFIVNAYALRILNDNIIVLDTKGLINWSGFVVITRFANLIKSTHKKIIYRPVVHEQFDKQYWEDFFRWIYLRQNTILYVDEAASVTRKQFIPFSYQACLARGRELNISTFNGTQRPKDIPAVIMSESENKYIFRMQLEGDRKRVSEFTGIKSEDIMRLHAHHFYYANLTRIYGPCYLDLKKLPRKPVPAPVRQMPAAPPPSEPTEQLPGLEPPQEPDQKPEKNPVSLLWGK